MHYQYMAQPIIKVMEDLIRKIKFLNLVYVLTCAMQDHYTKVFYFKNNEYF